MSHLAPAAAELIQEVTALAKDVKAKAVDRPDEKGLHRIIEFDPTTSEWLFPTLDMIGDERVYSLDPQRRTVTFVGDTRAENRARYPLMDAINLIRGHE